MGFVAGTIAYGFILWLLGILCAGGGHGVFFPLLLFSAPLGAAGLAVGAFGVPAFWTVFAIALNRLRTEMSREVGRVVLSIHYVTGCGIAWFSLDERQQELLLSPQGRSIVLPSIAFYLVGQVWLWKRLLAAR